MTHDHPSEGDRRRGWRTAQTAGLGWLGIWAVVAGTDLGWTAVYGGPLFLTRTESSAYYSTAAFGWATVLLLAAAAGEWAKTLQPQGRRLGQRALTVLGAIAGGYLAYATLGGRRVVAYRLPLAFVSTLLIAGGIHVVFRRLRPRMLHRLALIGGACTALTLNATVLTRLYPAFHLALVIMALGLAGLAVSLLRWRRFQLPLALALVTALAAGFANHRLTQMDNARFVAEHYSGLVGQALIALPDRSVLPVLPTLAPATTTGADSELSEDNGPLSNALANDVGPNLAGVDVLLITVDALRADILGSPLVPNMNALAAASVVFAHAYTPTPHTSYALSSLLTGKFLRPVLALSQSAQDHQSLPGILRQYGYRTAAFYPPAIFFVDRARFGALAERGFDFEYRKTMFAPAAARPAQLARYLDELEGEHPVVAWVHLFEPHEPYDPPEAYRRGESARERYDGEVAAADAAIGELIEVFRERRPNGTVIVSADHGEEFADHGGYHHGTTLYEEQIAIPLIWSSPGLPPRVIQTPVELVDIPTTLLSAMGIPRDVRMRGDDLGALLVAGDRPDRDAHYAFADVGDARMVMDGRYKAICEGASCQLYDLSVDPHERHNLASEEAEVLLHLRHVLREFTESIPRIEALALGGEPEEAQAGGGWPAALAAAELGQGRGENLVPLLASPRVEVRSAAARHLGEQMYLPTLRALERLVNDPDPLVAAEALLGAARLGSEGARESITVAPFEGFEFEQNRYQRRVAVYLAEIGRFPLMHILRRIIEDPSESEDEKKRAVAALVLAGEGGVNRGVQQEAEQLLFVALDDVNLRVTAATALGAFDSPAVVETLAERLRQERYLAARTAEASALMRLDEDTALPLIQHWLGTPEPLPMGVAMLARLDAAEHPAPPDWTCADRHPACESGWTANENANLGPGGESNDPQCLVVRTQGQGVLQLGDEIVEISHEETSIPIPAHRVLRWPVRLSEGLRLVAYVLVPAQQELSAPPPEPWDGSEAVGSERDGSEVHDSELDGQ